MTADDRAARAVWSALSEPGDPVAGALLGWVGAVRALDWLRSVAVDRPRWDVLDAQTRLGADVRVRLARRGRVWAARLPEAARAPDEGRRLGLEVVVPGDPRWPAGLMALGDAAPHCLWLRGRLPAAATPAVALVGSRACTAYGQRVAADLAHGLVARGLAVVSGGAYGIDAAAHRGALGAGGTTWVVLAGGVDRPYPAGNADLFAAAVERGGAVLGEAPPGTAPMRSRFLQRNRLIAAIGAATVVVEAAWRSGALSSAHHAAALLRPVGAVPGPVTSAASAGCHRLLREGCAVCVTDAAEVAELAGPVDVGAVEPDRGGRGPLDGLDPSARSVHDALETRRCAPLEAVAVRAGLSPVATRAALGRLELAGLVERRDDGWRVRRTR